MASINSAPRGPSLIPPDEMNIGAINLAATHPVEIANVGLPDGLIKHRCSVEIDGDMASIYYRTDGRWATITMPFSLFRAVMERAREKLKAMPPEINT